MSQTARAHCRLLVLYFMAVAFLVVMVALFSSSVENNLVWGGVFVGLFGLTCLFIGWYRNHINRSDLDDLQTP